MRSGGSCACSMRDLHGRRMRAQQAAVAEIERVVHRPRRMVRREVQRLEVVPVVLDLGPVGDFEAAAAEDVGRCAPACG